MKRLLMWLALPLVTMVSMHLWAQITPFAPPTIVPMVGLRTDVSGLTPVIETSITVTKPNQVLHVSGRLEFSANVGTTQQGDANLDYAGLWLECIAPNQQQAPGTQTIGQNYLGPKQSPGPNYPTTGEMVMYPSTLITIATPGTYSCQMLAAADKPGWAVGRDYQGGNTTWLGLSAPMDPSDAYSIGTIVPGCFWNNEAEVYIAGGCLYLGAGPGSHGAKSADLFAKAILSPQAYPGLWSPVPGAAFVDVTGVLKISMCGQIKTCAAQFRSNDTDSVVIDSYLELDQVDAAGNVLHTAASPPLRSTITNLLHHDMMFPRLTHVPVYPTSSPPQFQVKLWVTWVSGSTAVVDGAQVVAFTSYRGNPQAVPNVVGLTQSAASGALTASGYSLSLVSSGYGTAPAGTVIAQNPAAGVIEFPVAGVNLTLSTGSVTVPQVTGLSAKAAGETLIASGLVPNPVSHPGCTNPNVVLSQSPGAHTGVAPGSTVTFNYQSGKTNEGTTCAAP
jgi:hypothetical protein